MALIDLWEASDNQLEGKHIQQIIAFAGDGKLRDGSVASSEFRDLLSAVPSSVLGRYSEECLTAFPESGLALQDVVNEIGSRLGFAVEPGRYRGTSGQVGFDGLWSLADQRAIVVEVKTTDAYRIDLEIVAGYRRALIGQSRIGVDDSSMLIVVGRQDTGDLEAQIRGSRHAWDIRLISVDALLRLLSLKEEVEDPVTLGRIHNILFPTEFTKLDEIVDIVFSAAEDAKQEPELEAEDDEETTPTGKKFTPVAFHTQCIERIQKHLDMTLVKRSRASFSSSDKKTAVVCAVSRTYDKGDWQGHWFAFHPHQKDFLEGAESGYVAFGCGSARVLLIIPIGEFVQWLSGMNTTETESKTYWHVHLRRDESGVRLTRKKDVPDIDLSGYLVPATG